MNTTISNNGLPKLPQANSSQGSAPSQASSAATGTDAAASASGASDQVKLTDSARALQQAARAGDGSPVDTAKVEKVRQAIAAGTYQVNPQRIADGMLSLDSQIAGSKPVASGS